MRPTVTRGPVVSYTAVSPLPHDIVVRRSVLCCAISQVALGGRYPPSCSVEPGSSSVIAARHDRGHQGVSKYPLYQCEITEKTNNKSWIFCAYTLNARLQ